MRTKHTFEQNCLFIIVKFKMFQLSLHWGKLEHTLGFKVSSFIKTHVSRQVVMPFMPRHLLSVCVCGGGGGGGAERE